MSQPSYFATCNAQQELLQFLQAPNRETTSTMYFCHHHHHCCYATTSYLNQGYVFAFVGLSIVRITQKVVDATNDLNYCSIEATVRILQNQLPWQRFAISNSFQH